MKKFKILSDTVADGQRVHAGDIVELPEHIGHELCAYGKAEPHTGSTSKKEESNRSVGLEESKTPAPKKRAKK
jgi:hypothetical protein